MCNCSYCFCGLRFVLCWRDISCVLAFTAFVICVRVLFFFVFVCSFNVLCCCFVFGFVLHDLSLFVDAVVVLCLIVVFFVVACVLCVVCVCFPVLFFLGLVCLRCCCCFVMALLSSCCCFVVVLLLCCCWFVVVVVLLLCCCGVVVVCLRVC